MEMLWAEQGDEGVHRGDEILFPGGNAHALQLVHIERHTFGGIVGEIEGTSAPGPDLGEKIQRPVKRRSPR